jgi:hypothetical protein
MTKAEFIEKLASDERIGSKKGAGDAVEAILQTIMDSLSGGEDVNFFEIRRATNIDLSADNPFSTFVYWPQTVRELNANYLDLGSVFGYGDTYAGWATNNP